jgi:hypothetical protein
MAELDAVYGTTYQDDWKKSKNDHVVNHVANNLAHRQFNFHLSDTTDLWNTEHQLPPEVVTSIANKVNGGNKKMHLFHIPKKSEQINMFPELVVDSPVEYFMLIDADFHRAYFIYLTPSEVCAI